MHYEVFIPSGESDGFDVTMTVEADNWMSALKTGLVRTGEGEDSIRNVMCDIKDDNSIHVTDATSRRVFVLRELKDEEAERSEADASEPEGSEDADSAELKTVRMDAPDFESDRQPDSAAAVSTPSVVVDKEPESDTAHQAQEAKSAEQARERAQREAEEARRKAEEEAQRIAREEAERQAEEARLREAEAQRQRAERQRAEQERAEQERRRQQAEQAEQAQPAKDVAAAPPQASAEPAEEEPWRRIGSSTYESLRREESDARIVREERVPTGQRKALKIGREDEKVSENILEEVFLEINRIHEGEMEMEEVVNFVMDMAMDKVRAEAGSIMFADVNGKELYFATARGPKAHAVMDFRVPMGKGIAGFCAREGVSLAISDVENDPRFYRSISEALNYETKSVCCAPIQNEGRVYGAIELLNKENQQFTSTEVNVLTYIGRQLAKYVHDLIMAREKLE